MCRGLGTNQTWASQSRNSCDRAETPFSVGVGGEEPHTKHEGQLWEGEKRGLWPMQCRMAPHAGGLPGEGEETETGCRVFSPRLGVLTQWPSFWLLPHPPLPRPPGLGSSPTAEVDLWGLSTRNMPASQVRELGGSVVGN